MAGESEKAIKYKMEENGKKNMGVDSTIFCLMSSKIESVKCCDSIQIPAGCTPRNLAIICDRPEPMKTCDDTITISHPISFFRLSAIKSLQ